MQAKDAMVRQIVHLSTEETLMDAWLLMEQFAIRHLLVLDDGQLKGIVSDRDVLRCAQPTKGGIMVSGMPIVEVMTPDVITCSLNETIADIAAVMYREKIDALPVMDEEGDLKGLITSSDLLLLLFSNPSGATYLHELPFFFELVDWNVYPRAN